MPFSAREAARRDGSGAGARRCRRAPFTGVTTDTRTLAPGELFVAIRGETHDGHGFLANALAAGAAGLLVERAEAAPASAGVPVLVVPKRLAALGDARRAATARRFSGAVVAITGSNGKTTTKEMCAAILRAARRRCLATQGNLNNLVGLPLTLLRRDAEHAHARARDRHERAAARSRALAEIARPTSVSSPAIGAAHIECVGSREAIAEEKGDLTAALSAPTASPCCHADDPLGARAGEALPARASCCSAAGPSATCAPRTCVADGDGFAFRAITPQGEAPLRAAGLGEPTVTNALAATAACLAAGASLARVAKGLAAYAPAKGRMQRLVLASGALAIDDTYNANPQSMEAALASLARLRGAGARVRGAGRHGRARRPRRGGPPPGRRARAASCASTRSTRWVSRRDSCATPRAQRASTPRARTWRRATRRSRARSRATCAAATSCS